MITQLNNCNICPHKCGINRNNGEIGRCKSKDTVRVALYSIHKYEEPCISGKNGSGTIFFSNCNLNCIFCQNYKISQLGKGKEITIDELANIFLEQQKKHVQNINLVTPTSYAYQIIEAIKIARTNGFNLPVIYNTNGYESIETIKNLNGYVDVYLPDLKYSDDNLALKYSNVKNYFEVATEAIKQMIKQVGVPRFDSSGNIRSGVVIRHLVLPNNIENSKNVLKWIKNNLPSKVFVSIMAQYFPTYKAIENKQLNRKLTNEEWKGIEDYVYEIGIENGFIQELGEHEEEYVPNF